MIDPFIIGAGDLLDLWDCAMRHKEPEEIQYLLTKLGAQLDIALGKTNVYERIAREL